MLTEGFVYKKKGGMAYVKCARPESCEHCENSVICNKQESELRAYDPVGVSEGDYVEVETREDAKSILVISYIFLIPVAVLFASYWLYTVNPLLALIGVVKFAAYFIGLKIIDKKFDPRVKITRVIESSSGEKQD